MHIPPKRNQSSRKARKHSNTQSIRLSLRDRLPLRKARTISYRIARRIIEKNRKSRNVQPLIMLMLEHPNSEVCTMAAIALEEICDPKTLPALKKAMSSPHQYVYLTASSAIEKIRRKHGWKVD